MGYWLDVYLCIIATAGVALGAILGGTFLLAIIQFISYRVFKFNLIKKIYQILFN